jgi:hypothetical protein
MVCPKCGAQAGGTDKFCRVCGASLVSSAPGPQPKRRLSRLARVMLWAGGIFLGLSLLHVMLSLPGQEGRQSAPSPSATGAALSVSPAVNDEVISIDATSLLAAYQADEKAAVARFNNRKVLVTGVVSEMFLPPTAPSIKLMLEGYRIDAFILMNSPSIGSAKDADFVPGIEADSVSASLFGQPGTAGLIFGEPESQMEGQGVAQEASQAESLVEPGAKVTLLCVDQTDLNDLDSAEEEIEGAGFHGLKVYLYDCTLQSNPQPVASVPAPAQNVTPEAAAPSSSGHPSTQNEVSSSPGSQIPNPRAETPPPNGAPGAQNGESQNPSSTSGAGSGSPKSPVLPSAPQRMQPPANPSTVTAGTSFRNLQPATVEIPAGTTVEVLTSDPIASDVNRTGDVLRASLAAPIGAGDQIVVPESAGIFLRALQVLAPHRRGELTEIRLVLDHLDYGGRSYPLDSSSYDLTSPSGKRIRVAPGTAIHFQLLGPVNVARALASGAN